MDDAFFSFDQTSDLFNRGMEKISSYLDIADPAAVAFLPEAFREEDNDHVAPDHGPEESVGDAGSSLNFGFPVRRQMDASRNTANQLVPSRPKSAAGVAAGAMSAATAGAAGRAAAAAAARGDDVDPLNQESLQFSLMLRGAGLAEQSSDDVAGADVARFPAASEEYANHMNSVSMSGAAAGHMMAPHYFPHGMSHMPGMPGMPGMTGMHGGMHGAMHGGMMPGMAAGMPGMPHPFYGMPHPYAPYPYGPWMAAPYPAYMPAAAP
eukprot:TRINITY_DN5678_c0_g4_i1.p1 TRINITY_DN5678_c0_g4~~TRINITY_DN5678_c0_g4_i1.p1  ORF type:complete len:308 (-),score=-7.49 TRINITY_DN5678_c0_g4_i1:121-915(-)